MLMTRYEKLRTEKAVKAALDAAGIQPANDAGILVPSITAPSVPLDPTNAVPPEVRTAPLSSAERQRRHRAAKAIRAEQQDIEDSTENEDPGIARRIRENLRLPGEVAPGQDCQNIPEAIACARIWATFLMLPMNEVFPRGCTLRQVEEKIYDAWLSQGAPLLKANGTKGGRFRASQRPFEQVWTCLPGSDEIIVPSEETPAPLHPEHTCTCDECISRQQVSIQSKQMAEDLRTQQIQHDADYLAKLKYENSLPIWQP